MLEIENLSVSYGPHRAVDAAYLSVQRGEIVTLLGANGAGKTSLLNAIVGLAPVHPRALVRVAGRDMGRSGCQAFLAAGVAIVPQGRELIGQMTVLENLELGAHLPRGRRRLRENFERVMALFPQLRKRLRQRASSMSGGEQQMVAIGRALMSDPEMILLDEPTLGLSPLFAAEIFSLLSQLKQGGVSILLVEQNADPALALADRAYVIENGRICAAGRASSLRASVEIQRAFLGG